MTQRRHYAEILEGLKQCFPAPTSNPVMDGYFLYTVAHFLDRIDHLKGATPLLGGPAPGRVGEQDGGFPEETSGVEAVIERLVEYCRGMPLWGHPNFQAQVVPPPTMTSITAVMAASILNPNLVEDEASARFAEAEQQVVSQVSALVGYDPARAGGLFTFGGTATILYGCKLAIERTSGGRAMHEGVRGDMKLVASESAHYTRLNVAGWLGLGTRNVVSIPTTRDNEMSLPHLEAYLRHAFARGEHDHAAELLARTQSTLDAAGIMLDPDDAFEVNWLRERLG